MLSKRLQMASAVFFAATICLASAVEYQWIRNAVDYQSQGRRLVGHVVATYDNVFLATQCARRCQLHSDSVSFNFLPALRRCELNSASHVTNPSDVTDSDQSHYYLREAFTIDPVSPPTYLLSYLHVLAHSVVRSLKYAIQVEFVFLWVLLYYYSEFIYVEYYCLSNLSVTQFNPRHFCRRLCIDPRLPVCLFAVRKIDKKVTGGFS